MDRELYVQRCAVPGRAYDRDSPAEGLDPIGKADDPGAATEIDASDAVVANGNHKLVAGAVHAHLDDRCLRVLEGVRERLGNDVVGGHLDGFREPRVEIQVEGDRDGGA